MSAGTSWAILPALLALAGCTTYRDDLARGQQAFEQSSYDRALAVFRMIEPDLAHLDDTERTHYAYLRGMTDYRTGYLSDARHWLIVAKALGTRTPGALPAEWSTRLDEALARMNATVYATGIESLTNNAPRGGAANAPPAAPPPPAKKAKSEDEP